MSKIISRMVFLFALIAGFNSALSAQELSTEPNDSMNQDTGLKINIIVGLGVGYANNSGLSDFNESYGNYVVDNLNAYLISEGYTGDFSGSNEKADSMYDLYAEIRALSSSFGFGVGIGYFSTESELKADSGYWADELSIKSELTSVPVIFTAYYKTTLSYNNPGDYSFLLFGAGVGYYPSKITITTDLDSGGKATDEYEGSAIGYHALIEYNTSFLRTLNGFIGIRARFMEISEFKDGSYTLNQEDGSKVEAGFTGADIYFGLGIMI